MAEKLVPTLCVGMPSSTLRVVPSRQRAAERPGRYSHAERGNESPDFPATLSKSGLIHRSVTLGSFPEAFGTDSTKVGPISRRRRIPARLSFGFSQPLRIR